MNEELIELYKNLFFNLPKNKPKLKTFAIVDSIRDEAVKEKIFFSGLSTLDLWPAALFENEQKVPLYIIEIKKDNQLLDYLLNQYDKGLATYFISPYDIDILQRYYSLFINLKIEVEVGIFQKGIFGFYDPNILPNYIQTLYNEEKTDQFFAGIVMWVCPSIINENELYIAFRNHELEIDDVNLQLGILLEDQDPSFDYKDMHIPIISNIEEYAHEVSIDNKQMKMLN